jgi:dephospho-CoA kinase
MNKVIAVVGLPGAGKTEVTEFLKKKSFFHVYFGTPTFEELKKRGLEVNEKNERKIREEFRKKLGMGAYAILNLPKIREGLKNNHVVAESLYSWQEHLELKKEFGDNYKVIAVFANPKLRTSRMKDRSLRPYTPEELISRDYAHIENLAVGGPIARADFTVVNEGTLSELHQKLEEILNKL